jgi:pSer/pThr/pTyr-binding forkhead associated (FHA) protein
MPESRPYLKSVATADEVAVTGELLVGRNEECGLRLATTESSKPSGKHARLTVLDAGMSVSDLHSTNGTFVNGRKLAGDEVVPLKDGDRISFHRHEYIVHIDRPRADKTIFVPETPPRENPPTIAEDENSPEWLRRKAAAGGTVFFNQEQTEKAIVRAKELKKLATPDGINEPHLTLIENGQPTRNIFLRSEGSRTEWTVGKQPPCDIILDFPSISALHARIVHSDGKWLVEDKISSNGTWVDGSQVNRRYLTSLSVLSFGDVDCLFRIPQLSGRKSSRATAEAGSVWRVVRNAVIACALVLLLWAAIKFLG